MRQKTIRPLAAIWSLQSRSCWTRFVMLFVAAPTATGRSRLQCIGSSVSYLLDGKPVCRNPELSYNAACKQISIRYFPLTVRWRSQ